ncbi:MAG: hypothetical protein JSS51_03445 [Planctomycetes bacterium]|nr:hypothetical protein [Planctomycetota bacterium]
MKRVASRFVVKAGDMFGEFEGSAFGERVRKVVTRTDDGSAGTCMLGGEVVRGLPAVHISGLGMYGEKFPFCRVVETATVRTIHLAPDGSINPCRYDRIEVCALLRPDWATLRYGTPKGEQYEEAPTWPEFQPVEHIISVRGIYILWYKRGKTSFGARDVCEWLATHYGKPYLSDPQHRRAVNLLLDGIANVTNDKSTHIPYMRLERASGRHHYTWRPTWMPPSAESPETLAARACGHEAGVCAAAEGGAQ